jgi:hypothetical protein
MFNPTRMRVEDVLNAPSRFEIPIYQREYRWGKDEALDLMEDLRNQGASKDAALFLGNFIFEAKDDNGILVVDGQQRITTILLLLIACRLRATELGFPALAATIQQKITFIDSTTAESRGARLIASDSIRDVFDAISQTSWDGKIPAVIGRKSVKRQANRIRPILDYFRKEISGYTQEQLSGFLRAIYNAFVIRIDIEDEEDALSIFERTNARGMELEISDLLKNYLFSKKVDGVQNSWDQVVANSRGTILRMLKYFYVSKRGYVLKPQLYKKLKGYSAEVGAKQFTDEIVEFSAFYSMFKEASIASTQAYFEETKEISGHAPILEQLTWSLQALNEFGVTQCCAPAHAATDAMLRDGRSSGTTKAKALLRLFVAFEKYHFINNAVCERVGNEVEKLYADYCTLFQQTQDFQKSVESLIGELRSRLASKDEFQANFIDLSYSSGSLGLLSYIFDRFTNVGLEPGSWVRIYNPDPKLNRRHHNLEHFLPQTPNSEQRVSSQDTAVVDNIGNLLAISYKTNSKLGNLPPARKMEKLKGELQREVQNLSYVNEFAAEYGSAAGTWGHQEIIGRAKKMAVKAYAEVWRF